MFLINFIKRFTQHMSNDLTTPAPFHDRDHALAFIVPYKAAQAMPLPHFRGWVPAGFPSPAADWTESALDLNELCVEHPAATYFVRVHGDSMEGAGVHSEDILIVDQAIEDVVGRVVLAIVDGAFTVKRLTRRDGQYCLEAAHPELPPLALREDMDVEIRGVVTWSLHPVA
jgi:DNA polymerase V